MRATTIVALGVLSGVGLVGACRQERTLFNDDGGSSGGGSGVGGGSGSSVGGGTGSGGSVACMTTADCPGTEGDCATKTCIAGKCGAAVQDAGTPCDDDGGSKCDGEGACVECTAAADCADGVCQNGVCAMATCEDTVKNGDESDVDCGGAACPGCALGEACGVDGDCASMACDPDTLLCTDKKGNGGMCTSDAQCLSGQCFDGTCCGSGMPTDDIDMDGFTPAAGDCNDCDANVNPSAYDVINVDMMNMPLPDISQIDEDCSGTAELPGMAKSCDDDAALLIDSSDPIHAAKALDLCTMSMGSGWGLVAAKYVQIDGTALPNTAAAALGHGLLDSFGTNVTPKYGKKILALSTGAARDPGDAGYTATASKGAYTCGFPAGVPFTSQACPNVQTGTMFDSIALEVELKAPSNALALAFDIDFYTSEYPNFVCQKYNDLFLAVMTPAPAGAKPLNTGNITFDKNGEPLSVNNALLDVCTGCAEGTTALVGTGFETNGATGWLKTTAPVVPGATFKIKFAISDAADSAANSTVLVDNFRWDAKPGIVETK